VIAGALDASRDGIEVVVFGPRGLDTKGLALVEAADVIEMHEKPADAVRSKPDSSLVAACRAVGEGEADAVVSAGNTGAMLASGCSTSGASPACCDRRSPSSFPRARSRRC
jgi:glycerol-3-phosphate acyltransferase PlsX